MGLRKLIKNEGLFLGDEAPTKLFYVVRRKISWRWAMLTPDWKAA
ncbi:transposase, mutator type [Acidovorax sp. KKS102]|nr:transposase, mutator type [Acidovorax sp. KKS102]